MIKRVILTHAVLAVVVLHVFSQEYSELTRPEKVGTPLELGMAGYAKVLCSAIFVSGREVDEAAVHSGYFLVPEGELDHIEYEVNWDRKSVAIHHENGLTRAATFYGDQGCIIDASDGLQFVPVIVQSALPPADKMAWPMGDVDAQVKELDSRTQTLLDQALEVAFTPEALTAAVVIVHQGKIIAERYGQGTSSETQLESWSMGKSVTASLIGRMIEEGYFSIDDPAPIPEWRGDNDPRGEITIRHMLQMSSGLHFTAHRDNPEDGDDEYLDHFYIYTGAVDAFDFSINRPMQFPAGVVGRYRNCDQMALGYIMRRKLGDKYLAYPQEELFDKIGVRRQVLETDPYGNFLLSGYDYGTARNWARLGMLYLQDGLWQGERVLPVGWSDFVSSQAPGWDEPVYGGSFWLNGNGEYPLPPETYYMAGAGGQRTIIVPSMDLVIVRMGHFRGNEVGMETLSIACGLIAEALAR